MLYGVYMAVCTEFPTALFLPYIRAREPKIKKEGDIATSGPRVPSLVAADVPLGARGYFYF